MFVSVVAVLSALPPFAVLESKALDYLANKGFDVAYGARPIKRLLQKEVINSIAKALIAGKIAKGSTIKVDYMDGTLTFS